jgi:FkbM family methyltransferase
VVRKIKSSTVSIIGLVLRTLFRDKIKFGKATISVDSTLVKNHTVGLIAMGRYERDEIELCRKYIPSNSDIVELGASIGVLTSVLKNQCKAKKIICVEANPLLKSLLEKTLSINEKTNDIKLYNLAISDNNRPVYFTSRNSNELGKISSKKTELQISSKTLDELVKENSLGEYSLVCDIEGAESSFILSDSALKGCQRIIIELHETNWKGIQCSVEHLLESIVNKGFELLEQRQNTFAFKRID